MPHEGRAAEARPGVPKKGRKGAGFRASGAAGMEARRGAEVARAWQQEAYNAAGRHTHAGEAAAGGRAAGKRGLSTEEGEDGGQRQSGHALTWCQGHSQASRAREAGQPCSIRVPAIITTTDKNSSAAAAPKVLRAPPATSIPSAAASAAQIAAGTQSPQAPLLGQEPVRSW